MFTGVGRGGGRAHRASRVELRAGEIRRHVVGVATFSRLVPTAGRAGSGDGVYRAILETGVGRTGAVLDAGDAATGRRWAHGREAPFGPGSVQSRTPGPEERLSGCGTVGASTGGAGTGAELCARPGTTAVAHPHAPQAAVRRGPDAMSEPTGGAAGTDAHQVVVLRFGSVGRERAAHARSRGRRRHGPCRGGGSRRCEPARHPGTVTRGLSRLCSSIAGLSPAVADGVETVAVPGTTEARIGAGDHSTATALYGSSGTIGRDPRSGGGIGSADHRRNRSYS